MRTDFQILGGGAVYPGHPVTLAYLIVQNFEDYEAATKKGREFPGALESAEIPGAGGNVYLALKLLRELREGMEPTEAFERADASWGRVDGQKERYPERCRDGQQQADPLKRKLLEDLHPGWWAKNT